jgi:DNA-directed RNA polymerase specialized sigma subunit
MDNLTQIARDYLKRIPTKDEFNKLLDTLILNDKESKLLTMHYLKGYDLNYIADELGYSIQGVKVIHKKVLLKVYSYISNK